MSRIGSFWMFPRQPNGCYLHLTTSRDTCVGEVFFGTQWHIILGGNERIGIPYLGHCVFRTWEQVYDFLDSFYHPLILGVRGRDADENQTIYREGL